jgi:hypothetical protein
MPYKVEKNGEKYDVVNEDTNEVKATHDTKEEAEAQVRLLHAVENDPEWEKE